MSRIYLLLLCSILVALPTWAKDADLGRGIRAYTEADYPTAIAELTALDEAELRPDERVVLHKFLALSFFARKEKEKAREEFIKLLTIDPGYELKDGKFAPSVLDLFQKAKRAQGTDVCDRGVESYNAGHFREAMLDFEQALLLNPKDTRAGEFQKLTANRLKEEPVPEPPKCIPSRAWSELDAQKATCQGVDYSTGFRFPIPANRITLIYSKHHFGVGTCWKVVLYDVDGNEVLALDDPTHAYKGREEPANAERWRIVDLPEVRKIARVRMYGEGGHAFGKFMGQRVNKDFEDKFILGLEVACPAEVAP
jgi:tetratricopeptide (TPR) repeat protein